MAIYDYVSVPVGHAKKMIIISIHFVHSIQPIQHIEQEHLAAFNGFFSSVLHNNIFITTTFSVSQGLFTTTKNAQCMHFHRWNIWSLCRRRTIRDIIIIIITAILFLVYNSIFTHTHRHTFTSNLPIFAYSVDSPTSSLYSSSCSKVQQNGI